MHQPSALQDSASAEVCPFNRPRARSDIVSGYSFKTSQYGLALDNIAGYELVLPNGTITSVTSKDKDLWFGLRVSRELDKNWVSAKRANFREG